MAVAVESLVVGKQYRFDDTFADGCDWFVDGSIVTITSLDGSSKPPAKGPAKYDNIGSENVKKGEEVQGYVPASCLFEIEEVDEQSSADYCVTVENDQTQFIFRKRLSLAEVQAVLAAAGV